MFFSSLRRELYFLFNYIHRFLLLIVFSDYNLLFYYKDLKDFLDDLMLTT